MSRIGRRAIPIPKGVTVKVDVAGVDVKGPKGQMRQALPPGVVLAVDGNGDPGGPVGQIGRALIAIGGIPVAVALLWTVFQNVR